MRIGEASKLSTTTVTKRQTWLGVVVLILLLALISTRLVSAAQVTDRSAELSNSSVSSTNVSYTLNFTAVDEAAAFVVEFCSNSPSIGQPCTAPTGFDASAAASTTPGFTDVTAYMHRVVVAGGIATGSAISVQLTGITNPSQDGPVYARVVTYNTKSNALTYTSTDLNEGAVDEGAIAIAITNTIGVSGYVPESLTFCLSGELIGQNCAGDGIVAPVLELGESIGNGGVALSPDVVSEGVIHTQLSTNAVNGAVVRLKSNAVDCGGLLRAGAPTECNIEPAQRSGVSAGQPKFGVKTELATDAGDDATGTLQGVTASGYNRDTFVLNYAADNTTGVTSAFGDPFLDTNGAPANNKNLALRFGVSISTDTPAGVYSTNLFMIATGKF